MTLKCVICRTEIDPEAKVCPQCQASQSKTVRRAKKVVSSLSAFIVVITAITLSIKFFPDAYRNLFYEDKIELHSIKTNISGGKGLMAFQNTGSGDVFINEISFEASDNSECKMKKRHVIVNSWIKRGEVLSYPYETFAGAPNYGMWPYIQPNVFRTQCEEIGTDLFLSKARHYYRLEVFDKEYRDPGVSPLIDNVPVVARIRYSSLRSDGVKTYNSEKELWGQIRNNERALKKLISNKSVQPIANASAD